MKNQLMDPLLRCQKSASPDFACQMLTELAAQVQKEEENKIYSIPKDLTTWQKCLIVFGSRFTTSLRRQPKTVNRVKIETKYLVESKQTPLELVIKRAGWIDEIVVGDFPIYDPLGVTHVDILFRAFDAVGGILHSLLIERLSTKAFDEVSESVGCQDGEHLDEVYDPLRLLQAVQSLDTHLPNALRIRISFPSFNCGIKSRTELLDSGG